MITERDQYLLQIKEACDYISGQISSVPEIGVILGTGLGGLVEKIDMQIKLPYNEIPHFPESTVESHAGRMIVGTLGGKKVLVMQGRFHLYEGYSMQQITFPVRVMGKLGIKTLLVSNAAGGMNPNYRKGDLVIMEDHINLLGTNPLIGQNLDDFGPRFPDMSEPYSQRLIQIAEEAALENQMKIQKGVFVAVAGPNLETRAEYRFLRTIGADVVGMSTVPEDIVAVHQGMEVFGVSVITDECFPDALQSVDVAEIIAVAAKAEPKLTLLMEEIVKRV